MKPTWAKRKEFALFGFHSQSSGRAKLHHRNSSLRQTSSAESWKHPAHALQLSDWSVPTLENLEGSIQSKQLGQQPAEGSGERFCGVLLPWGPVSRCPTSGKSSSPRVSLRRLILGITNICSSEKQRNTLGKGVHERAQKLQVHFIFSNQKSFTKIRIELTRFESEP